jgi:hypothetical protein
MLKKIKTRWPLTLIFALIIIILALILGLIFKNLSYVLAQTTDSSPPNYYTTYNPNTITGNNSFITTNNFVNTSDGTTGTTGDTSGDSSSGTTGDTSGGTSGNITTETSGDTSGGTSGGTSYNSDGTTGTTGSGDNSSSGTTGTTGSGDNSSNGTTGDTSGGASGTNTTIDTTNNPAITTATLKPEIIIQSPKAGPISGFLTIVAKVTNNEKGVVKNLEAYCGSVYLRSLDINYNEAVVASWNTIKLPDGPCNFYLKNNLVRSTDIILEIENQQALEPATSTTTDASSQTTITNTTTTAVINNASNEIRDTDETTNKPATIEVTGEVNKPVATSEPARTTETNITPATETVENNNENRETTMSEGATSNSGGGGQTVTAPTETTAGSGSDQTVVAPTETTATGAWINLETLTTVEGLVNETQLTTIDEPTVSGEIKNDLYQVTSVETIIPPIPVTSTEIITPLLEIRGKATPNSFVILYIYSKPIVVVVKTDAGGNWTYLLDKPLANGQHEVYVASTNTTGKIVSKSEPFTFFIKEAQAVTQEEYNGAVNITDPFQKTDDLLKKQITFFSILVILLIGLIVLFYVLKNRHKADIQ